MHGGGHFAHALTRLRNPLCRLPRAEPEDLAQRFREALRVGGQRSGKLGRSFRLGNQKCFATNLRPLKTGQRQLDQRRADFLRVLQGGLPGLLHRRLKFDIVKSRHAQTEITRKPLCHNGFPLIAACMRPACVVICAPVIDQSKVFDARTENAHVIKTPRQWHHSARADAPIRRLEAIDAAVRSRYAHGAECVTAQGRRAKSSRHRRAGAAGRAARGEACAQRIFATAEPGVVVGGAERRFMHVEFAEDHRAAGLECTDDEGVAGGDVVAIVFSAAGGGHTGNVDIVFDRNRNAIEQAERCALCTARIRGLRSGEGRISHHVKVGAQARVVALDSCEIVGDGLARRNGFRS